MSSKITEGYVDHTVKGSDKPCKTWYRVVGDLSSNKTPLVVLHGGPGIPSVYLRPFDELNASHGIPIITYDQTGCGSSTHFSEKNGDEEFWTVDLFLVELNHVLSALGIASNYDLCGHSWGGMLAAEHAIRHPKGLHKLILSNSPSSIPGWAGVAAKFLKAFPQDMQDIVAKHEAEGTTDSEEYNTYMMRFYEVHTINTKPLPEPFNQAFEMLAKDPTVYHTMQGPSEFTITGNLRDWSVIDTCKEITAPTLVINGSKDIADDEVLAPFVKNMSDCKMITFQKSSHMPFYEEPEAYFKAVSEFLGV